MHDPHPTPVPAITRSGLVAASMLAAIASFPAGVEAANGGEDESPGGDSVLMAESIRTSVRNLVVLPGDNPAERSLTGTYGKETPGLVGGADAGSRAGTISRDVGGANISVPIPILTLPGAILGGLSGATRREIQDFRDALTEDLAKAANQALTNEKLALDVYRGLQRLPEPGSRLFSRDVAIPQDSDAILYVSVKDVAIDIDGSEAILTTSAQFTLQRRSDGRTLFESTVAYRDRDALAQWTRDDNALWDDYKNFARHYLGREIAARAFDRSADGEPLRPARSSSVKRRKKDAWTGVTRTTTPTLAWEPVPNDVKDRVPGAPPANASDIAYDVEVYDNHRLVYDAKLVPGSEHTVAYPLEPCTNYRWSVRPAYRGDGGMRFGDWMRSEWDASTNPGGISGKKASTSPAYTRGFASLTVDCRSR